jgi:uncharacterized membrane protein YbhN (UPF0104 family)
MAVTPVRKNSSTLWNVLKIVLALILVGFVLSRTDLDQFLSQLERISIPWLVFYVVLFLSLTLLKALQYYYLNGRQVTFPRVLNVVVMQNAITNYFASTAGIASYLAMFRAEHGVKVGRSALIFLLTKIGDLIIVWLALCVSSMLVWQTIEMFHSLVLVLILGVGVVLLVFFLTVLFRQKFVSLLGKILDILRLSRVSLIQKGVNTLETLSEIELGKLVRILGMTFILSTVYFIVSVILIYASYAMFDFRQDIRFVLFVTVLLLLISYIPIQIFGGLGVTETSSFYFWSTFNVPQPELASVLIGIRIFFYFVNLLPLLYLPIYSIFLSSKSTPSE